MPLILAVEPDPRQASRLSVVLRGRRHTEVVVAKSAAAAIEAMAGRIPDVLLTSQLLSPQDELRLADWLKELGPAAAHVHALTIPILAVKTQKEEPQRGLLAGLRRRTQHSAPQGCEPKMFAEHVAAYLEQGLAERLEGAMPQVEAVAQPETVAQPEPVAEIQAVAEVEAVAEFVSLPETEPEPAVELQPEPVLQAAVPETVITEPFVAEAAAPHVNVVNGDEDEGLWLLTRSSQVIEFSDEPPAQEPDTLPLGLLPPVPDAPQVLTLPREVVPIAPLEIVFIPPEVITVRDDAYDTTGLRRAAASAAASSPVGPLEAAADTAPPIQDEWGFFDPNKCGFSALLDKLDEITDEGKPADKDAESLVRIVTHY
jgi:CheY-like chemotaxis protein